MRLPTVIIGFGLVMAFKQIKPTFDLKKELPCVSKRNINAENRKRSPSEPSDDCRDGFQDIFKVFNINFHDRTCPFYFLKKSFDAQRISYHLNF